MIDNRTCKIKSEEAMGTWTASEMGEKRAKKKHKVDIRRRRRMLEKRMLKKWNSRQPFK